MTYRNTSLALRRTRSQRYRYEDFESKSTIRRDFSEFSMKFLILKAARNILLSKGHPKVSDFGLSRVAKGVEANQTQSNVGPLKWMAPENLLHKQCEMKICRSDLRSSQIQPSQIRGLLEFCCGRSCILDKFHIHIWKRLISFKDLRSEIRSIDL
jgi:serine/threonine protein kinase